MEESVFTKIIRGDIACQKVFEDDLTFVFLDQSPLTKGHLLVVPKEQIDHLDDCDEALYDAVFSTVHKMSKLLRERFKPQRVGLVVHGFEVPHAHVHVVPLYTGKELRLAGKEREMPTSEELAQIREELLMVSRP